MPLSSVVLALAIGIVVPLLVWKTYSSPLKSIPGPFLAKYTDFWRLLSCWKRQPERAQRHLHDKFGPVVRLGPNMISLSDPAMVPEIYSRQSILNKGDFYMPHDLNVNGHRVENIFSTRNEQLNSAFLKPVTKLYSMGYVVRLEPLIDSAIDSFIDHLNKRFAEPKVQCDIHNWLHYVAWDVIAELTFGKRLGFMDHNKDVEGMMAINAAGMDYASVIGMMPWLDHVFERNPIVRIGPPAYVPMVNFCISRLTARATGSDGHDPANPDMLDGFLEAKQANPQEVQDDALMAYMGANVVAGSDTVAAELRSVVYYLGKNPAMKAKLQAELDAVDSAGCLSWAECQKLPYLCACVSEGCRILPGVGLHWNVVSAPTD